MSENPKGVWPRAVLFDLDGTLIDSAPDITAAVNELLAHHLKGPLALDRVRRMIGNGVEKLVERAFAAAGAPRQGKELNAAVVEMMEIYGRHPTNLTTLMPGAVEVVAGFAAKGIKLAVVSNKPKALTGEILVHYGFSTHLSAMQGAEEGLAKKPAPDMLLQVLHHLDVTPDMALFVGDSRVDVEAAQAAKMKVVLVQGGYPHEALSSLGADRIFDNLDQLLQTDLASL